MSSINYNVYGAPSTWQYWVDAKPTGGPNNTVYGQQRTGASDWNDADFTDYPAFKFGQYNLYRNYYVNSVLSINTPIDNSISYSAIANPDLPQQNVVLLDQNHTTINNYLAKVDNTSPSPFCFGWYYVGSTLTQNPSYAGSLYGFDGFPNNAAVFATQSMQRVAPYASYDTTFTYDYGKYNPNLRIAPCVQFGTKSIILEINVRYDNNDNTSSTATLKNYLNHTSDWLQSHKMIGAYCVPYFRVNTNGTYLKAAAGVLLTNNFTGLCAMFFRPYKLQGVEIYNHTAYFSSADSGNLPIFGAPVNDSSYTSADIRSELKNTPSQTSMSSYACLYGANRGTLTHTHSGVTSYFKLSLDMSVAENVEYIMKGAAAYGLFFCTDIGTLGQSGRDTGVNERWADSDMYLGIIRADGMTYGDYTRGTANKDQLQYQWKDSTQTPFVPSQSINDYSQQTRIRSIGHIDTMTDRYVLNSTAVNALSVDLFGIMSDLSEQSTNWADLFAKTIDNFLVQNPIDCIISLKKYPVKEIPNTGTLTNIHYGRYSTGSAAGYPCTADVYTYAFQPKHIQPRFENSFLDYEPYTSAELYIPYCGSVSLKMCDILGKQLQPFLCVDYHTGQCTGFVMCDGIVIETIQGTIAVDVPVTGIQTATVEGQLMNAANSARQIRVNQMAGYAKSGLIVGAATLASPVAGAVALASQIKNTVNNQFQRNIADYNLSHTEAPQHVIGTSSSACSWIIDSDTARLILYYPAGDVITENNPPEFNSAKLSAFGAKSGFATVETGTLSQYTGFTSGDILTDGINATDTEKDIIKSLFATGIYL